MKQIYFLILSFIIFSAAAIAQCPVNIGFENGGFAAWDCKMGTYGTIGANALPVINLHTVAPFATQHTITSGTQTDPNTNDAITVVAPGGGNYSVRIGDGVGQLGQTQQYANAVGISYTIPVVTKQNASLTYMYALVVEEATSTNHSSIEAPRFEVILRDNSKNQEIPCGRYYVNSSSHNSLYQGKTNIVNGMQNGIWWYSKWTKVAVDLSKYIGNSITLEFRVNDCAPLQNGNYISGLHAAYAYVDLMCGYAIANNPAICANTKAVSICAPAGSNYKWEQLKKITGSIADTLTKSCIVVNNPAVGEVYKVNFTSAAGCDLELTDTIKGLQVNTVKNITLCARQVKNYQLKAEVNTANKVTYSWSSVPAGFTSTIQNPLIATPTQSTKYVVTVKDSIGGCITSDTINVNASCDLKVTTTDATLCKGSCAVLAATVTGGVLPYTYKWDVNGSQTANINVCPTATITYTVTATDFTGATATAVATVFINDLPDVKLAAFTQGTLKPDSPAFDLTGGTPSGGLYSGTGVAAGKFDPAVAGIGTHVITYTYKNDKGCSNSATQNLVVSPASGISNLSIDNGLAIYPNPHTQSFTIETAFAKQEFVRIQLLNMLGEVVSLIEDAALSGAYKKQVSTVNLPAGIYFLSVQTANNIIIRKLIKN